jgi:fructose-1,6-bisphosphatase I
MLKGVIAALFDCFIKIDELLRQGYSEGYLSTKNISGDRQVKLDILSNEILVKCLREQPNVAFIASEELVEPIVKTLAKEPKETSPGKPYSVVFDPLDGSSVCDSNMAVGTIVGIYEGETVLGRKGREQVAALMAVYGPKLTVIAADDHGVTEYQYDEKAAEFKPVHKNMRLCEEGKIFSPGNLNIMMEEKWYHDVLHYWLENGYKLRYSGSMAADLNNIIKKNGGVFLYPGSKKHPGGKIRLLYECAPLAFIVEKMGGVATDGKKNILDLKIETLHQGSPLIIGSKKEVERAVNFTR